MRTRGARGGRASRPRRAAARGKHGRHLIGGAVDASPAMRDLFHSCNRCQSVVECSLRTITWSQLATGDVEGLPAKRPCQGAAASSHTAVPPQGSVSGGAMFTESSCQFIFLWIQTSETFMEIKCSLHCRISGRHCRARPGAHPPPAKTGQAPFRVPRASSISTTLSQLPPAAALVRRSPAGTDGCTEPARGACSCAVAAARCARCPAAPR